MDTLKNRFKSIYIEKQIQIKHEQHFQVEQQSKVKKQHTKILRQNHPYLSQGHTNTTKVHSTLTQALQNIYIHY